MTIYWPSNADNNTVKVLSLLLITFSAIAMLYAVNNIARAVWIQTKSMSAQILLVSAWQQSQENMILQKPWPWADIKPVARLDIPAFKQSLIVLNDDSGEALAFGPGLIAGDLHSLSNNIIVIGGHRDTHLMFMKNLNVGDKVYLENHFGDNLQYEITSKQIVDTRSHNLAIAQNQPGLVLVTCYPFDSQQTGGPLRLFVTAEPIQHPAVITPYEPVDFG